MRTEEGMNKRINVSGPLPLWAWAWSGLRLEIRESALGPLILGIGGLAGGEFCGVAGVLWCPDLVAITYWYIKYAELSSRTHEVDTFVLHVSCASVRYCENLLSSASTFPPTRIPFGFISSSFTTLGRLMVGVRSAWGTLILGSRMEVGHLWRQLASTL